MTWWPLSDDFTEGGVLEFDNGLELHVYEREGQRWAIWMSDDGSCYRRVVMGEA